MQCSRLPATNRLSHTVRYHSTQAALTLHHKAQGVLARTLAVVSEDDASTIPLHALDKVHADLSDPAPKAARIVVRNWSEKDLVGALLDHPFSPVDNTLLRRWKERTKQTSLTIQHGEPSSNPRSLTGKWQYLQSFPLPVEITEVTGTSDEVLYSADIPLTIDDVFGKNISLVSHPNSILLSTDGSLPPLPEGLGARTVNIQPDREIWANALLRENPSSPLAVQVYKTALLESRISEVTRAIHNILSSTPDLRALRARTAFADIRSVLYECRFALNGSAVSVSQLVEKASILRDDVEQARARLHMDVLVGPKGVQVIPQALEVARRSIEQTMDRLTWWRTMWRVDELSTIVNEAVERAWCKDLEKLLIMHTGRLSASQKQLETYTHALLSTPSPSSAILSNTLQQTSSLPSYPLTSSSLTAPLHTRLNQIMTYPTTRLHLVAQKAVFGAGTGILGGAGIAGAGWAGLLHVPHVLTPLLGSGMEVETAAGVGMLGAAVGLRWAVGKWEGAKKRWWEDVTRVGQGMERDITTRLDEVFATQVAIVPEQAILGLETLAESRLKPINEVRDDVESFIAEANRTLVDSKSL